VAWPIQSGGLMGFFLINYISGSVLNKGVFSVVGDDFYKKPTRNMRIKRAKKIKRFLSIHKKFVSRIILIKGGVGELQELAT
jgi:hypothetical protein